MIVDVLLNNGMQSTGTLISSNEKGIAIKQSSKWLAHDIVRYFQRSEIKEIIRCREAEPGLSKRILEEINREGKYNSLIGRSK